MLFDSTLTLTLRTEAEILKLICEKGNQGNQRLQESNVNTALSRKMEMENPWLE